MLQFFLNPWLLTGLAGTALPVIAHLLVRRRYHVMDWGAMQFLQPGQKAKRRLQLQDLLLLLLRIALVMLLTFCLARPWLPQGWFTSWRSSGSRDVVLVIDSSSSMSRQDGISTLHQTALRQADRFLDTLAAGDTVMLIDARDQPITLQASPQPHADRIRSQLERLPPPAGFCHLPAACEKAVSLLSQAQGLHRDIVVFTDQQRASWHPENPELLSQLDEFAGIPSVPPRVWLVDCSAHLTPLVNRISVGGLTPAPETVVPGQPFRLQVKLTNHTASPVDMVVELHQAGQRLPEFDRHLSLAARSSTSTSWEHVLSSPGDHLLSADVREVQDALPVDNNSQAVVSVRSPLQVLLIESSPTADSGQQDTLFLDAALSSGRDQPAWVRVTVVSAAGLVDCDLSGFDVIVASNPHGVSEQAAHSLNQAVRHGTGLLLAIGPDTTVEQFQQLCVSTGLLPSLQLVRPMHADPGATNPIRVHAPSLQEPWLQVFREHPDSSFLQTVFQSWWQISRTAVAAGSTGDEHAPAACRTLATLTNRAPLLLQRQHDQGHILLLTVPLHDQWSNLPGRPDFVSFLYEALFQLAPQYGARNVDAGTPLTGRVTGPAPPTLQLQPPYGEPLSVPVRRTDVGEDTASAARVYEFHVRQAVVPGSYRVHDTSNPVSDYRFCVDYNHAEDNPAALSDADRKRIEETTHIRWVQAPTRPERDIYGGEQRTELWMLLLGAFILLLVVESWLTHRLVHQRHGTAPTNRTEQAVASG